MDSSKHDGMPPSPKSSRLLESKKCVVTSWPDTLLDKLEAVGLTGELVLDTDKPLQYSWSKQVLGVLLVYWVLAISMLPLKYSVKCSSRDESVSTSQIKSMKNKDSGAQDFQATRQGGRDTWRLSLVVPMWERHL